MEKQDTFQKIEPLGLTKSFEYREILITSFEQPPNHSISWHAHEMATLLFVFGGSVDEKYKKRTYECLPSSLLIRPAEETHGHRYGNAGAKCLAVQVKRDSFKVNKSLTSVFDSIIYQKNSPLVHLGRKIQTELQFADDVSSLAIESIFLEILVKLRRNGKAVKKSPPPRWLKEARDLVHSEFRKKISLNDLSKRVGIHPSHVAVLFRKYFGLTIGEYVRNLRLEYAFREVKETEKTFAQIAAEAGFYDQSHFTKRYRETFDQTPSVTRTAFRKSK